jgi:hypothetical protein
MAKLGTFRLSRTLVLAVLCSNCSVASSEFFQKRVAKSESFRCFRKVLASRNNQRIRKICILRPFFGLSAESRKTNGCRNSFRKTQQTRVHIRAPKRSRSAPRPARHHQLWNLAVLAVIRSNHPGPGPLDATFAPPVSITLLPYGESGPTAVRPCSGGISYISAI